MASLLEKRQNSAIRRGVLKRINKGKIDVSKAAHFACDVPLEELAYNIAVTGLLAPLSVVGPYPGGIYYPIDGVRRYEALCALSEEGKIPCYVVSGPVDDKELRKLAVSANALNRSKDAAIIMEYEEIFSTEDSSVPRSAIIKQVAAYTGKSCSQIYLYDTVYTKGSEAAKKMVVNGDVPVRVATDVIHACGTDYERQNKLINIYTSAKRGNKGAIWRDVVANNGENAIHGTSEYKSVTKTRVGKKTADAKRALTALLNEKGYIPKADSNNLVSLCGNVITKLS